MHICNDGEIDVGVGVCASAGRRWPSSISEQQRAPFKRRSSLVFAASGCLALSLSLSLSAPADPRNSTPSVPHKEEGVRNWSFFFFLLFDGRERIGRSDLDSFEVRSCFFSFSLFLLADENTTPSGVHLFACVGRSTRHLARK